jgi:predicted nucleic acid-binding protein
MRYYLDTNVILRLYRDAKIGAFQKQIQNDEEREAFISDLGKLELTSVLMRISRTRDSRGRRVLSRRKMRSIIKRLNYDFQPATLGNIRYLTTTPETIRLATELIRTYGSLHNLRCRDAIHLALMLSRNDAGPRICMVTNDKALANLCQKLGVCADTSAVIPST